MDWKLELVPVPVTDLDQAKSFYGEQVGFTVDFDIPVGDSLRIVQLTPPGSACSILLGGGTQTPPGSLDGLVVVVPDVEVARAELAARGVEVSDVQHYEGVELVAGPGGDWNSFVFFSDPDGNGWTLQEQPAARATSTSTTTSG
jgi:catechol 2,3-dioxygenase-like lactoylglutathione lyase family enzyme